MKKQSAFPEPDGAYPGMTLRDWFAGQALTPLVDRFCDRLDIAPTALANLAYMYADAMIAEREKTKP
jgi:hypothetical protein